MARFTGLTADVVHAETDGGQILLTHGQQEIVVTESLADAESWWNLRRLHVGHELPLTVWLDDIDPFRDLADPVPPARLDQAAFDRWSGLIADAWAMLCRDHREDAEAMAGGVVSLVPLVPEPGWGTRSASNGEAFGSVMVSEPPDAVTLAEALVHEFQHIKLGALMHLVPLTDQDDGERYYAPWRDDPRPLGGLLQGVYAFFGIAGFWRNHRRTVEGPAAAVADYEYACTRAQTDEALRSVLGAPALTHEGRMFVEGLQARLAAWLAEPLPDEVARLAALTADSHRTGWRLRHVRPDAHAVRALAKAWEESHSAEPVPDGPVEPHPNLRWPQRIPALARRRIKAMAGDDRAAPAPGTGLTAADEALVSGDVDQALASYLASLPATAESDDDAVRAWVGLSLSHAGAAKAPSASALSTRPELVRAVHSELAAAGLDADPLALGGWLAPG
jgi:hypothetical protein